MPESSAASKFCGVSPPTAHNDGRSSAASARCHGSVFAVDRVVPARRETLDRGQRNFRILIPSATSSRCKQRDTIVKNTRDTEQRQRWRRRRRSDHVACTDDRRLNYRRHGEQEQRAAVYRVREFEDLRIARFGTSRRACTVSKLPRENSGEAKEARAADQTGVYAEEGRLRSLPEKRPCTEYDDVSETSKLQTKSGGTRQTRSDRTSVHPNATLLGYPSRGLNVCEYFIHI